MIITTTAIGFILLFIGLAFLGWQFLKVFNKKPGASGKNKAGKLLALCFFATAAHNFVLGFGALFFAENPQMLFKVSISSLFFLVAFALFSIYTAYYLFLPNSKPYYAMSIVVIVATAGLFFGLRSSALPFLTPTKGIDWNMGPQFSLVIFSLLLVSLSIFSYIFIRLFKNAETPKIRLLSSIIAASALIGILNIFIRLIVLQEMPGSIRTTTLDIGIGSLGALFIVGFIILPLINGWTKE